MKKLIKALGLMAFALILITGMSAAVNADTGSYTIKINDAQGSENSCIGNTYTLYKIAGFNVSGGVYTNIETTTDFSSLQTDLEALNGKDDDSTEAVAFANSAAAIAKDLTTGTPLTVTKEKNSFNVTETGYYLVVDTAHGSSNPYLTTKYILVAVDGLDADLTSENTNENISVKTSTASVEKKIVSEHDSNSNTLEDANTVAIGDTVTYQLDATIPTYDANATGITYRLTDVMSDGLTYKSITSVQVSANGTDWTNATYDTEDSSTINTAGATVKIKLTDVNQIIANTYVRVKLTATLNENANTGASGNPNSVDLTYSNNYYGGGESYTTPEDTVITYTGKLNIVKVDSDESTKKLSGAVFMIYRVATADEIADEAVEKKSIKINNTDTQVVEVATTTATDANGETSVTGLDVGTYYAVETTAPEGYSIDATPIPLALTVENNDLILDANGDSGEGDKLTDYTKTSAANANLSAVTRYPATFKTNSNSAATITNKEGLSLPGTGGMGTKLFTFGGLALVILAAVLFLVSTKKQNEQA